MTPETDLLTPLRRYWGYSTFRPLQERIVRSLLAGRDTCVVMPTGGGKSLCYQLPAVVSGGTAVGISPLIALMQDQATQLAQMGIPAAVLNSTLSEAEQTKVMSQAREGAYRLLYVSPERVARGDTMGWMQQVPVTFFAIDEAHCISEWGHEFRPEYRQLNRLRTKFPDRPIAAFTASATRHVRHDILAQLQLRNPDKYIASFYRSNLRYLVRECEGLEQMQLLERALRSYAGSTVIVYSPTINRVEETVDFLEDRDIPAVGYHGKMGADLRRRNQERWMSDEVRVLVGTIAFGLGINKAAVRAVIHLSLPKSIEQYYQEAGRAGRDGLPADCVMLWQPKDAGLLVYFIDQLQDPAEKQRAWQRYHTVRRFAESARCRHLQICTHFGQTPKWERCEMCDVCGNSPAWLVAAPPEELAVRKKRKPKAKAGVAPVRVEAPRVERTPAPLTVPARRPVFQPAAEAPLATPTAELLELFKEWRRRTAERFQVPAYIVLSDAALADLCRKQPSNLRELLGVTGIGERKAEQYGSELFATLEAYRKGARAEVRETAQVSPAEETMRMLAEGCSFEEIAKARGRQVATVVNMVADLVEKGRLEYRVEWVGEAAHRAIAEAVERLRPQWLKPLREALPAELTDGQIRLVVAWARRAGAKEE